MSADNEIIELTEQEKLNRWRLLLGRYSEGSLGNMSDSSSYERMESMLDYLYSKEYSGRGMAGDGDGSGDSRGGKTHGSGESNLTVPDWITQVRELFPAKTVEIMEKHALDRYNMEELITDKETLEKLQPSTSLLKSIMQMKHLMKGDTLNTALRIVAKVVDELKRAMETKITAAINGKLNKNSSSNLKIARNLDFHKTIRKNLRNYDVENSRLMVDKIFFNSRTKLTNPWDIIISIDESGSMLDSVIHSAVMAGIFSSLPSLRTKLFIFDTAIVDLSHKVDDIVRTLMSVQLGGGTDIAKAFKYCGQLIANPSRTIVVMVTDLYSGYDMFAEAKKVIETGAKLIILTSLDKDAQPDYDKEAAKTLVGLGAEVAALTPESLAKWIAEIIS